MLCSHSDNCTQCKCARTLGMLAAQSGCVLISWMAGRGAGAGRLPFYHLGDRIRCLHLIKGLCTRPGRGDSISKSAYNKKLLHKVLCPPSSKCPSGAGFPHRYPEQLATPFWLPQKCKKKGGGYWCSTGLCFFDQTFQKLRPLSATIQENATFTFLSILEVGFFAFFFLFSPFFALIRATLGFFVVFPNKSYTLIRATLGFEFFGPNKS